MNATDPRTLVEKAIASGLLRSPPKPSAVLPPVHVGRAPTHRKRVIRLQPVLPELDNLLAVTAHEATVVGRLALGLGNKAVAREFDISVRTVEKHRQRVMKKLKVSCFVKVVHYALQHGWAANLYAPMLAPAAKESK